MNQKTKKPHFVPASYLQFWDTDDTPNGRKSRLWWTDGKKHALQSVNNICVQSGLYSTSSPNEAEQYFSEFERDWSKLVFQLKSGKGPKAQVLASLFLLQSSYFLLRNPKFQSIGEDERIDIYKTSVELFWQEVLMDGHIPERIEDAPSQMQRVWNVHLLPARQEPWITSDNPVLLLSYDQVVPAIIYLPITPTVALLALRNEVIRLSNKTVSSNDTKVLNAYTVINSRRHVYSMKSFQSDEIQSVSKWLDKRPSRDNWIETDLIHIEPFLYPSFDLQLKFL